MASCFVTHPHWGMGKTLLGLVIQTQYVCLKTTVAWYLKEGWRALKIQAKTHMVNPCSFLSITTSYLLSQKVIFGIPHWTFTVQWKNAKSTGHFFFKQWALGCSLLSFQTHTTFSLPRVTSSCTFPRVNIWGIEMLYGWAEEGKKRESHLAGKDKELAQLENLKLSTSSPIYPPAT